ncbi:chemotaxis protein CheW [Phaeobacter sp. QD34_3]|uniref:chemotaxis protein CheW n=1 Tax=unclassified Phaeobacter TaxID=2621772 RepID=UPI00237F76C8|nr:MULTISPECIES: chemotaxis protein CheW [unclassified Phaeobacter]MDE4133899.1 chemotaxis protein CheW [Phaeobacter sp. QD34_3]MDE4137644.1 chemotaxis protein CheW [Phaeobacter sp. QD34_24]
MQTDDMTQETSNTGMLLIFRLDGEAFAISVTWVHEILDPQRATPVPNAGPFAPGLINVRGAVVPVIDIRHRLGLAPGASEDDGRMIVFEHPIECTPQKLAFCADSVEQVIEYDRSSMEQVPQLGAAWPQAYLRGAIRDNGELVILLETETTFAPAADRSVAA